MLWQVFEDKSGKVVGKFEKSLLKADGLAISIAKFGAQ